MQRLTQITGSLAVISIGLSIFTQKCISNTQNTREFQLQNTN